MKFKCYNCNKEWVVPKEKLVYISDWPEKCPYCESTNIGREIIEEVISSSRILENINDKELEKIRRKKLERMLQEFKKEGGEKVRARIVIPVVDESGLNARLAEHFGRSPYFAVVDLDENGEVSSVRTVPNVAEHFGGGGQTHDRILELQPNAIVAYGMGPRGLIGFQNVGVAVLRANANTVREVIAAYKDDKLQELTEGCHHARHP